MNGKQFDLVSRGRTAARSGVRRRDFVAGALLGGALWMTHTKVRAQVVALHCVPPLPPIGPIPFNPATSGAIRTRKSVFELDANEVSRLKAAYAALRNVYRDDPRSWHNQGLVHCWYCSGAVDGLYGQEIHGGWWFLPWHRAFLYFHEQILAQLLGDPSFALPYWDWDSPDRNRFPSEVYGAPGDTTNPLYDGTRAIGPDDRIPNAFVGINTMQQIMSAASFAEFGGSSDLNLPVFSQTGPQQAGAIEGAPHGGVHLWVTDPAGFSGAPNMGALGSASFDPVFFAHHANIDRLWGVWLDDSNQAHANPDSSRWLMEQPFYFYDHLQNWTAITIDQLVDHATSLRYQYQPPSTPAADAIAAMESPSVPPLAPIEPLSAPIIELAATEGSRRLTPEPTTVEVAVPPAARDTMMSLAESASNQRLLLRIDGVELPADRGAVVNVFLNRPDATAATGTDEPGFVGTIVVVPSIAPGAGHLHGTVLRNFGFDITHQLPAALEREGDISVTLVPFTGEGRPPGEIDVRYERVYIASR